MHSLGPPLKQLLLLASVILDGNSSWGAWVAQLVERPTLDGSGHDLTVREFKPRVGLCADMRSLLGILSLSPSLCPFPLILSLSLKISKH